MDYGRLKMHDLSTRALHPLNDLYDTNNLLKAMNHFMHVHFTL